MKIGVVSDTHIPKRAKSLPQDLLDGLKGVDLIIHGGDVQTLEVLDIFAQIAPVEVVVGNNDVPELYQKYGFHKTLSINGFKIGVTHGHGRGRKTTIHRAMNVFKDEACDCIIFGHSHQPYNCWHDQTLVFNPGSPTDKRKNSRYSFGFLHLGKELKTELVYF